MFDIILLIVAGFCAGALNTVAGGGSFLTFPALVFTGVSPIVANATSTAAVLPGYLGGVAGFRRELAQIDRATLIRVSLVTLVGSSIGSVLLLVSSNEAFAVVVPFLLLGATLVFLYGAKLRAWAAEHARAVKPFGWPGLLAVTTYGGYFNGGMSIIFMALFSLWGMKDIHQMNGLKTWLAFTASVISVLILAAGGLIAWAPALVMMVAALAGGYLGAPLARALPLPVIRGTVAAIGFGISAYFFTRLFF